MCLLYKIIRGDGLNEISDQLIYRNVDYSSRYNLLFRLNTSRTNYGLHVDLVCRLQLTFVTTFNEIDILNITYTAFKTQLLMKLNETWMFCEGLEEEISKRFK